MGVYHDCVQCGSTDNTIYIDKDKEWFCKDCLEANK